jgi:Family of unknown function (DUF6161)
MPSWSTSWGIHPENANPESLARCAKRLAALEFLPQYIRLSLSEPGHTSQVTRDGNFEVETPGVSEWVNSMKVALFGSTGARNSDQRPPAVIVLSNLRGASMVQVNFNDLDERQISTALAQVQRSFPHCAVSPLPEGDRDAVDSIRKQHRRLKAHGRKLKRLFDSTERRLEGLTDKYIVQVGLDGPVKFWDVRYRHQRLVRRAHLKRAIWTGVLGAVAAVLVLGLMWSAFGDQTKPPYWILAGVLLIASLWILLLRGTLRLFWTAVHLENDAAHRQVLAKTYLALHAGGKVPNEDDRRLILEPLFRPVSDGVVNDGPVGLAGVLAAMIAGRKS